MSWIAITRNTLYEAKVAALIDALDSKALKAGQPARADGIIQGVVNEVRSYVATCATNRVDEDATKIPTNLRDLTVDLIIFRLKNTLEQPLREDEQKTLDRRQKQLERVGECKLVVDQPDTAVEPEVQPLTGTPRVTEKTRRFTRCDQEGI